MARDRRAAAVVPDQIRQVLRVIEATGWQLKRFAAILLIGLNAGTRSQPARSCALPAILTEDGF
ncbi:protein of unknown function [Burkholderia multivorans]